MTRPQFVPLSDASDPMALYRTLRSDALAEVRGAVDGWDRATRGLTYKSNPALWAKERAGLELWSGQRTIITSVRDHRQTAVQSCHEIGKSFSAALTSCWWIDVHAPGEAFVVTTAPSDKQVKAILWREINRLHSKLGLVGRTNLSEWYIGKELVAFGRKPADYDPTAFQGLHARFMLVVLDEACGIPKELWDAASSLTANVHGRTLAIGNPDDEHSEFAANCLRDPNWHTIKIGYRDTPNFTGEPISESLSELLIGPDWVEERRQKWGEDSALFISKCNGEFPRGQSPYIVIPLYMAENCRWVDLGADPHDVVAGLDIGAGGDRTILRERRGPKLGREAQFVDSDPMKTIGMVVEKIVEWGVQKVIYDTIGIGWALGGRLKELSSVHNPAGALRGETTHSAEVAAFNAAETPRDPKKFLNKRAEMWWHGRELSRLGLWDLEEADDDVIGELTAPLYELMDSSGRIKIERKDEIIKRLGQSPDRADAVLMAYYPLVTEVQMPKTSVADYELIERGGLTPGDY